MRHVDYREPAPFAFTPLTRTGNRVVGTWWRTSDGHFLLVPGAGGGWALSGRSDAERAWLAAVGLGVADSYRARGGPQMTSITEALLRLADALRADQPVFDSWASDVRFAREGDGRWLSTCGRWEVTRHGGELWLAGASDTAVKLLADQYDAARLHVRTLKDAGCVASRMVTDAAAG
jgi:hypothetical protein